MVEWFIGLSRGVMRYWTGGGGEAGEWKRRWRKMWGVGLESKDKSG